MSVLGIVFVCFLLIVFELAYYTTWKKLKNTEKELEDAKLQIVNLKLKAKQKDSV